MMVLENKPERLEMSENKNQQQLNIELGEKESEGIYSNLAIISHSAQEFVIDFTRIVPGVPKAKVYSRIIMTPSHAKMFLQAMRDNVAKYEQLFGEIKVHHTNFDPSAMGITNDPGKWEA